MTRVATPKLGAYAGLGALGLLAALALELPELVAVSAPFLLAPVIGLALTRPPELSVSVEIDRERVLEGESAHADICVSATRPVEWMEVFLPLPPGLSADRDENPVSLRLRSGDERRLGVQVECERWGAYLVGDVHVRARDRFALVEYEDVLERRVPLKVYPRPEALGDLLRPLETQVFSGNQVARDKGEGIEFADIRPFLPGDRVRRVNWRASARRRELWVNEYHAERNADVILFLDSFAEARRADESTLDRAVRAAAALADQYLRHKDRVGLVSFGGVLNWLLPRTGLTQLYRVIEALLDTEIVLNYAWKDIDIIPTRTLPPKALVVAITPLLDERAGRALLDLRARGFDLSIAEVSPVPFVEPGADAAEQLAYRIWLLKRDANRARYERAGVPVATWDDEAPLVAALEEIRAFRRFARPLRV